MDNEQLLDIIKSIKLYPVISSNIKFLGYDANNKILKVVYNNNSTYAYFGIPESLWDELLVTESKR